jgi:1-acyl-sn-glycerol-3-phosphate acyltransferase
MLLLLGGVVAACVACIPVFFKPVWFGLGLVGLLGNLFFTLPILHALAPGSDGYAWSERWCNILFRMLFGSCVWLRIDQPSTADWDRMVPQSALKKGAIFMVNHTSYVDGFVFSALTPQRVIARSRTLMKGSFFSTPVIGSVFRHLGHMPVYFQKETDHTTFSVDKEKQAKVTLEMRKHLAAGGILAFCPEGTINRTDPTQLLLFRRGTFAMIAELRLPVFGLTTYGNHFFWPNHAHMGGYPSTIVADVFAVDEWNSQLDNDALDAAAITDMCQRRMQESVTKCVARSRALAEGAKSK